MFGEKTSFGKCKSTILTGVRAQLKIKAQNLKLQISKSYKIPFGELDSIL
jgi:hypothetical protein